MDDKKNLMGSAPYDVAADVPETEPKKTENTQPVQSTVRKQSGAKQPLALISLIVGICSVLIIFVLPIFGLALGAVGSIVGIVLGIISRKEHPAKAWTGIVLSIVALLLVLAGVVLLGVIGWNLLKFIFEQIGSYSYGYELPNYYNGFYLR